MNDNKIYINGFWDGFLDNTDANNINIIKRILEYTKINSFDITTNIDDANILLESVFEPTKVFYKNWKYKIHFSGENKYYEFKNYDVVLFSSTIYGALLTYGSNEIINTIISNKKRISNVVDFPLFSYYIHSNHLLDKLINKPYNNIIPKEFCCFIVSNPNCLIRNKMFDKLNSYKKVHSYGKFNNNMNYIIQFKYWSNEFIKFISNYKFIICFENSKFGTYMTEKIINPYLANIIPIYWSSHHVKKIFNMDSMIFMEDETDESYNNVIQKIIELDNDDEQYLKKRNKTVFSQEGINYWNNNYTIEKIGKNTDNLLYDVFSC